MSDEPRKTRWQKFDEMGEREVRARVAAQSWGEEKIAAAKQWLDQKASSDASTDSDATLAETRAANELARSANDLAEVAITSASKANAIARDASAVAKRSEDAARTNNVIAMLALVAAAIAIAISIIGIFIHH